MPSPLDLLFTWWIYFVAYSVGGWAMESTYCSIGERRLVNRGFLNGPYCPIYGAGGVACAPLCPLFSTPSAQGALAVFLVGGAVSCLLEFVTSIAMERAYHARWWDYSDKPLNLQGRVWVGGFAEFGLWCVLIVFVVQPVLGAWVASLGPRNRTLITLVTLAVFLADFVVTNLGLTSFSSKMDDLRTGTLERLGALRESLPDVQARAGLERLLGDVRVWGRLGGTRTRLHELRDAMPSMPPVSSLSELAESFAGRLTSQERRIMRAFPTLRPTGYRELLNDFRNRIRAELGRR